MNKPPTYRVFREAGSRVFVVFQLRDPESGELVDPADLQAYRATKRIRSPYGDFRAGSRLVITPHAARHMLEGGTLAPMREADLAPGSTPRPRKGGPEG